MNPRQRNHRRLCGRQYGGFELLAVGMTSIYRCHGEVASTMQVQPRKSVLLEKIKIFFIRDNSRLLPALACLGALTAPVNAALCPPSPGGLPSGKAEWRKKGDPRWFLNTSDKKGYPCALPVERKEMNSDGIYTDYEHTDFICEPLKISISKCVMDEGRSYYPKYGTGKDFYTTICELGGSRWKYSLVDKNGEKFSLDGFPEFSLWEPNSATITCTNSHNMKRQSVWAFKSGAKYLFIIRIQNYVATAVKQPAL